jgi:hypothetical protein
MVTGAQTPRVKLVPKGRDHPRWSEIVDFIGELGVTLDPWQLMVLRASLRRKAGRWAASRVGVCAPRQNGKNGILEIRELIGPLFLDEQLIVHTSHLADTSQEAFRRLEDLIEGSERLQEEIKHIWRRNGFEQIEFKNRARIRFRTRTGKGGRGFAKASPIVFDEAMYLPEASVQAAFPTQTAAPDPQTWYMGSAVDKEIMEDGTVFARVREEALKGEDERLAYFEWSLDIDDPDEVPETLAEDLESWARTNPAFGIRITPDYLKTERSALGLRGFAVERLGVGDWPDTSGGETIIDLDKWNELADPESLLLDPVYLAFDVSPNRSSASISAAGIRGDELMHVETIDHKRGVEWVVPRLKALVQSHEVAEIVCDGYSPAGALIHELEELGVAVTALNATDYGRACGALFDLVEKEGLRHLGTPELRTAIKGAKERPLGEAWAWARKKSSCDITPLVSATLSLWGARVLLGGEATFAFA